MAEPHLRHLLPWQDLLECCKQADGTEVVLPTGACGRIHANGNKHLVASRGYLSDMLCP